MSARPKDTEAVRRLLIERRRELERVRDAAVADVALTEARDDLMPESAGSEQDPADAGSDLFEREKSVSIAASVEARVEEVDAALDRLEAGTYGMCLVCEQPIDVRRLDARPEAAYCVDHQPPASEG